MIIFVEGKPRGKGRPRFTRSGSVYTDKQTRDYERRIAAKYKQMGGALIINNPVNVCIQVQFKIPTREKKATRLAMERGEIYPTKKPDVDNIVKVVLDALNGVAYADDKQVIEVYARKVYGGKEGVAVSVRKIGI